MIGEQKRSNQGALDDETVAQLRDSYLEGIHQDSMMRLQELYNRPYFSRVWCVQEVVATPTALLKCEELEIPLMDVMQQISLVRQMAARVDPDTSLTVWYLVWDSKQVSPFLGQAKVDGSIGTMLRLLDLMRTFQATDIRDKIFALQGICDEGLQPAMAMTQIMGEEGTVLRGARRLITRVTWRRASAQTSTLGGLKLLRQTTESQR